MENRKKIMYQIFHSRSEEKIKIDNLDVWVRFVIRPISFVLTYPFIKFNISANSVSYLSMVFSFIGMLVIFFFQKSGILITLIIFNFWIIFDAVDGNVARTTGKFSKKGTYIDAISGYLYLIVLYISLGMAVYFITNQIYWIIVGFVTSIMTVFPRLVLQKKIAMFGNGDKDVSTKTGYGFKEIIALNVAGPAGLMNPLMIVAYLFNDLYVYLAIYAVIQITLGIITIISSFKAVNING